MSADSRFFVDTNVLLYSVDPAEPGKRRVSRLWLDALWAARAGNLSWQVLHEFYVNAVRKLAALPQEARTTVEVFAFWRPIDTSLSLVERAWHWMDRAQLAYWDALIVAAAERAGCQVLLTEDLQEGSNFGPVQVVNPFRHQPEEFGVRKASGI